MGLGFTMCFPVGNNENASKEHYEKYFSGLSSVVPEWNVAYSSDSEIRNVIMKSLSGRRF